MVCPFPCLIRDCHAGLSNSSPNFSTAYHLENNSPTTFGSFFSLRLLESSNTTTLQSLLPTMPVQNPLRRPGFTTKSRRDRDVERQNSDLSEAVPGPIRGHFIAMTAEFVGTVMFLFFAFSGTQIANNLTPSTSPSLDQLLFISLSFGFSLAVSAWSFYRVSGGLFNPAVQKPSPYHLLSG